MRLWGAKEECRQSSDVQRNHDYGSSSDITTEQEGEVLKNMWRTKVVEPDKSRSRCGIL